MGVQFKEEHGKYGGGGGSGGGGSGGSEIASLVKMKRAMQGELGTEFDKILFGWIEEKDDKEIKHTFREFLKTGDGWPTNLNNMTGYDRCRWLVRKYFADEDKMTTFLTDLWDDENAHDEYAVEKEAYDRHVEACKNKGRKPKMAEPKKHIECYKMPDWVRNFGIDLIVQYRVSVDGVKDPFVKISDMMPYNRQVVSTFYDPEDWGDLCGLKEHPEEFEERSISEED